MGCWNDLHPWISPVNQTEVKQFEVILVSSQIKNVLRLEAENDFKKYIRDSPWLFESCCLNICIYIYYIYISCICTHDIMVYIHYRYRCDICKLHQTCFEYGNTSWPSVVTPRNLPTPLPPAVVNRFLPTPSLEDKVVQWCPKVEKRDPTIQPRICINQEEWRLMLAKLV